MVGTMMGILREFHRHSSTTGSEEVPAERMQAVNRVWKGGEEMAR
jgi:hypothetical protein